MTSLFLTKSLLHAALIWLLHPCFPGACSVTNAPADKRSAFFVRDLVSVTRCGSTRDLSSIRFVDLKTLRGRYIDEKYPIGWSARDGVDVAEL